MAGRRHSANSRDEAIRLIENVIDHHVRFHCGLKECIECVTAAAAAPLEVYEALEPGAIERTDREILLYKEIEAALPTKKLRDKLAELDECRDADVAAEGSLYLLLGLMIGLRWTEGLAPEPQVSKLISSSLKSVLDSL